MKIEVTEEVRQVKWEKGGKKESMTVQVAWAHVPGDKYPTKIEVVPPRGEAAYAAGNYVLAPESVCIVTDSFGKAKLGIRPKLLTQSQAAARVPSKVAGL